MTEQQQDTASLDDALETHVRCLPCSARVQALILAADRLALKEGVRDDVVSICDPIPKDLAFGMGCSERTVFYALDEAERTHCPFLTVGRKDGCMKGRRDLLTVHRDRIAEAAAAQLQNCKTAKLQTTLLSSYRDPITVRKEENKEDAALQLQLQLQSEGPDPAERLYDAYPKKVGRGHAIPAIKKALRKERFHVLLERVEAFARSPKAKGPYCWNPATWFNGEHWKDDPQAWEPKGSGATPGLFSGLQSFASKREHDGDQG